MADSPLTDDRSTATFSDDDTYRYRLRRTWDTSKPTVVFVMLNPSTADATADDPTIRRCLGFAETWGYGALVVGNLFALRATDPADLRNHSNPVGPENDRHLREMCTDDRLVVGAWGANGSYQGRAREVLELLDVDLHALDTTKAGHPVHPLYQPADTDPEPYNGAELQGGDTA